LAAAGPVGPATPAVAPEVGMVPAFLSLAAFLRAASRRASLTGARHGFAAILNGYKAQLGIKQPATSAALPPLKSKHFLRIARSTGSG
jgi:hypothetical protein